MGRPEFPLALDPLQLTCSEMADFAVRAYDAGINYIGACCGTPASHIRSMAEALGRHPEASAKTAKLELFPQLHTVRVLRRWGGVCDKTPDFAPIIGQAEEVEGFFMSVGWGTYGFKAGPAGGRFTAELVATRRTPPIIAPFSPSRFREGRQLGEKAAAVSH